MDAVSFVTALVSMRLRLSVHGSDRDRHRNRVVLKMWSIFERIRFNFSRVNCRKRRNLIDLKTVTSSGAKLAGSR